MPEKNDSMTGKFLVGVLVVELPWVAGRNFTYSVGIPKLYPLPVNGKASLSMHDFSHFSLIAPTHQALKRVLTRILSIFVPLTIEKFTRRYILKIILREFRRPLLALPT